MMTGGTQKWLNGNLHGWENDGRFWKRFHGMYLWETNGIKKEKHGNMVRYGKHLGR